MADNAVSASRSHRMLMVGAILMAEIAIGVWVYRFMHTNKPDPKPEKKVVVDLRFIAPIGYEFCTGRSGKGDDVQPPRLPHKNLALTLRLPPRITNLPPDAGAKEIAFRRGKHAVDVYKHLDSGRLIHTYGTIRMEGNTPVLNTKLAMGDWPPGRYIVGIGGDVRRQLFLCRVV